MTGGLRSAVLGLFVLTSLARCRAPAADVRPSAKATQDASTDSATLKPSTCTPSPSDDSTAERDEIALALAQNPNDPKTLAAAAELYLSRLPPSTLHKEIGLLYAKRGSLHLQKQSHLDKALLARLWLLEAEALLDLGRAQKAMRRIETLLAKTSSAHVHLDASLESEARYELAVAHFELCQLHDAKRAFEFWLGRYATSELSAWAHHHLGLTLEMLGQSAAAERELLLASRAQPKTFAASLSISAAEFDNLVKTQAELLPKEALADLQKVHLQTADLPELADLTLEEPPLSPTIVGLFRGLPLGQEPSEPRSIVLYRKNLLRAVRTAEELRTEVRITLQHELGHLRGADDQDLRERGLE